MSDLYRLYRTYYGDMFPYGTDAFGRLRTSYPVTLFDSKQIVDNQALFWDDAETSGGGTSSTYNTNQASTTLAVSANTAGTRIRQTKMRFNYQPGKSQMAIFTGILGAGEADITRWCGLVDSQNGLFYQLAGSTLAIGIRSYTTGAAVDTLIPQSQWNLDRLDGLGESQKTIDPTKAQIFFIDFEWLGVGNIRFGIYIDGIPVYVHTINHFNQLTKVYMSTPNLPLQWGISNGGAGAVASLTCICSTVISEGGQEATGMIRSASRGASSITTPDSTALIPLISIRLKSAYLGISVTVLGFDVVCTSTAVYEVIGILNPTIAGEDAASWVDLTDSAIQYDISRTNANTLTNGYQLQGTIVSETNQSSGSGGTVVSNAIRLGAKIDGTRDELVLAVRRLVGTTETFYARIGWRELL